MKNMVCALDRQPAMCNIALRARMRPYLVAARLKGFNQMTPEEASGASY
jgi:hypothetical protein